MKNLYIFCFILLLSITLFFICGNIDIYTVKSKNKGPKILLIGGTHGNEPAGYVTLLRLQNAFKKKKLTLRVGELTIIHNINSCGYFIGNRHYNNIGPRIDLNRFYNKNFFINKKVENIVDKYDIILDFHEGWGYINRKENNSIGSSIQTINIPKYQYDELLKIINNKIHIDYKKWSLNTRAIIDNTLRDYCLRKNKKYMLIETSGQNNVQNINVRINQSLEIINYILKKYKLL